VGASLAAALLAPERAANLPAGVDARDAVTARDAWGGSRTARKDEYSVTYKLRTAERSMCPRGERLM